MQFLTIVILSFSFSYSYATTIHDIQSLDLSQTRPQLLHGGLASSLLTSKAVRSLLSNSNMAMVTDRNFTSKLTQSVQYLQTYKGVQVLGGTARIHGLLNSAERLSDLHLKEFDLDVEPALSSQAAITRALDVLDKDTSQDLLDASATLKILPNENDVAARLVYFISFKTALGGVHRVIVDAHTGKAIANLPDVVTIAPINIVSLHTIPDERIDRNSRLPKEIKKEDITVMIAKGKEFPAADESAKRVLKSSTRALEYYKKHHQRDSYDGKDSALTSMIHVGNKFNNAAWVGGNHIMIYGDGDGEVIGDLTKADDVTGHEITHGVVESAVAAGDVSSLLNFRQSGALNEAIADFLGELSQQDEDKDAMSDNVDWIMGKDLFVNAERGKNGVRNLKNPDVLKIPYVTSTGDVKLRGYPAHMNDFLTVEGENDSAIECDGMVNDACYVHGNATIIGHMLYLLATGFDRTKTEKLAYTTLTHFLNPLSGFQDFRDGMMKSCTLLELSDADCKKVDSVMSDVGLSEVQKAKKP